ncbi:MAG: methanol dehydrogenase [cytochrome c] subunit [Methylobacter sp.]|nr:methanol dehydrogenase [cytochrome c] subunit [Methylobacter sp.]MDP2099086.1 methanol dehydrogenase [cytochrome c] subunit [Methylobacter sp.]MDP2426631.1 methanol dehydrogenase [cytochrome c] subunit [Methylobacter sp.]MDP3056602.1 methanol dehydrogenase [cytochrome c] subunit [Methylobacter sp.]MDP3362604.1 methanol dehydrogenase [cytochrome c] subunit [Methylobacter sp.]
MKKMLLMNAGVVLAALSYSAIAYDGQNCKEPGVCWEPKPGYPEKVAGSKYDPKHDVNELNKQAQSVIEMEERNKKRQEHLAKTGKFVYDVDDIE